MEIGRITDLGQSTKSYMYGEYLDTFAPDVFPCDFCRYTGRRDSIVKKYGKSFCDEYCAHGYYRRFITYDWVKTNAPIVLANTNAIKEKL